MLTPEIQSPEFYDRPIAYPENDAIPATALAVLAHLAKDYGKPFILSCIGFQQAMDRQQPESGYALNPDHDQPTLVIEDLIYRGEAQTYRADLYQVWIAQRAQKYFQSLAPDARNTVEESLGSSDASALLNVPSDGSLSEETTVSSFNNAPTGRSRAQGQRFKQSSIMLYPKVRSRALYQSLHLVYGRKGLFSIDIELWHPTLIPTDAEMIQIP